MVFNKMATSGLFFYRSMRDAGVSNPGGGPYVCRVSGKITNEAFIIPTGSGVFQQSVTGDVNIFDFCTSWIVTHTNINKALGEAIPVGNSANFETDSAGGIINNVTTYREFANGSPQLPFKSTLQNDLIYNLIPAPGQSICFVEGSLVETDQGSIKIEEIDTCCHTINGKNIIGLVKSDGDISCLAHIKQNLISDAVPNLDTFCSPWHKI